MKFSKKYIAAGSAVIRILESMCLCTKPASFAGK
ncbi:Uncharacterised protein [Streptococcus pneumoniae]|nr:Uncharacterised protein [Streptococcus pneumoniae]CYK09407.1 Uncharacterised protein [Streptococcus pneumoniae]